MDMNMTNEKLNFLHSLLDKELNNLEQESNKKENKYQTTPIYKSSNKNAEKETENDSITLTHSTNTTPKSQKDQQIDLDLQDIQNSNKKQQNNQTYYSNQEKAVKLDNQSKLMQTELMDLQNKLQNLEKRITDINSPLKECKQKQKNSKYIKSIQDKLQDSYDYEQLEPMTRKYNDEQIQSQDDNELSFEDQIKETSRFNTNNSTDKFSKNKFNSSSENNNKENICKELNTDIIKNKKGKSNKKKRENKFQIEQTINQVEAQLNSSKSHLKKSTSRKSIKTSSSSLSKQLQNATIIPGKGKCLKRDSSMNSTIGLQNFGEIAVLNKKITQQKKLLEEYKSAILKERQNNQKLIEENELLKKDIKKKQIQFEKNINYEQDFQKLTQNFQKSEYIRQQQKQLIQNLKNELESVKSKRNDDDLEIQNIEGKTKKKSDVNIVKKKKNQIQQQQNIN